MGALVRTMALATSSERFFARTRSPASRSSPSNPTGRTIEDCTTPRSLKDIALLLTAPNASSIYVNDLAACIRDDTSGYDGSMYVFELDDLSALLTSLVP